MMDIDEARKEAFKQAEIKRLENAKESIQKKVEGFKNSILLALAKKGVEWTPQNISIDFVTGETIVN